jgi:hypothetical protein
MPTEQQIEAATKAMMAHINCRDTPEARAHTRLLARVALQAAEKHDINKVLAHRCAGRRIENAKHAFERRFGKSMMPLAASRFTLDDGRECVKLLDTETGTWAEYTICTRRVKRLREHDAA